MGSKEETPKKRARFPTGKVCLLHRSWDGTKVMEANGSPFNLRSWTNTSRLVRVRLGVLASPEIGWSDLPGSNNSNGRGRSVGRNASAAAPSSACSELDYGGGRVPLPLPPRSSPGPDGVRATLSTALLERRGSLSIDRNCKHPM